MRARKKKFADTTMQRCYDTMVIMTDAQIAKAQRRGGSQDSAFADGFEDMPQEGVRDYRGTWAYAAWCAGQNHPKSKRNRGGIVNVR